MIRIKRSIKNVISTLFDFLAFLQVSLNNEPTFIKSSWAALEQWIYCFEYERNNIKQKEILIICFRNKTWVEWSIFAALNIYSMGYKVTILYSEKEIQNIYSNESYLTKTLFSFWKNARKIKVLNFINIDEQLQYQLKDISEIRNIDKISMALAAKNLRVEEFESDYFVKEYESEVKVSKSLISNYYEAYKNVLKNNNFSYCICPSGLIGQSLALAEITKVLGITTFFVEAWCWRPGHLIWRKNLPAHFFDIIGWKKLIGHWDKKKEEDFLQFTNLQKRSTGSKNQDDWLDNYYVVQREQINKPLRKDILNFINQKNTTILLGTNVIGDSATLMRHSIFKNQKEWLREIVNFFNGREDIQLIIRVHPDELRVDAPIKLGEFIKRNLKLNSNIMLIDSVEPLNTYNLIPYIKGGLIWLSTLGVDLVLSGKPILIAAKSNYVEIGVADYPESKVKYFQHLESLIYANPVPTPESLLAAKYYKLIVFKYMSLRATGDDWKAHSYRLGKSRMHHDKDKFYKIIVGELDENGNNYDHYEQ